MINKRGHAPFAVFQRIQHAFFAGFEHIEHWANFALGARIGQGVANGAGRVGIGLKQFATLFKNGGVVHGESIECAQA